MLLIILNFSLPRPSWVLFLGLALLTGFPPPYGPRVLAPLTARWILARCQAWCVGALGAGSCCLFFSRCHTPGRDACVREQVPSSLACSLRRRWGRNLGPPTHQARAPPRSHTPARGALMPGWTPGDPAEEAMCCGGRSQAVLSEATRNTSSCSFRGQALGGRPSAFQAAPPLLLARLPGHAAAMSFDPTPHPAPRGRLHAGPSLAPWQTERVSSRSRRGLDLSPHCGTDK